MAGYRLQKDIKKVAASPQEVLKESQNHQKTIFLETHSHALPTVHFFTRK